MINFAYTILYVKDVEKSIDFYEKSIWVFKKIRNTLKMTMANFWLAKQHFLFAL
jgi:predicted enzyme related to lactoylglutathione lyase